VTQLQRRKGGKPATGPRGTSTRNKRGMSEKKLDQQEKVTAQRSEKKTNQKSESRQPERAEKRKVPVAKKTAEIQGTYWPTRKTEGGKFYSADKKKE